MLDQISLLIGIVTPALSVNESNEDKLAASFSILDIVKLLGLNITIMGLVLFKNYSLFFSNLPNLANTGIAPVIILNLLPESRISRGSYQHGPTLC